MSNPLGLIVMYHYVRPDASPIPAGIRPLLVSEFETQLDWLTSKYDIVPADRFNHSLRTSDASGKPPCLLTFDDGTKDHSEVVTPILASRGLSGLFFVLTWPAELGRMPLTHAVHWLLSSDEGKIWESFERTARDELGGSAALGDPAEAYRIYHYESPLRARIKYAANMVMPAAAIERIIEGAVTSAGRTMAELAAEWFVSADDIRVMDAEGMTIASHGCSHRSLQSLGGAAMRAEIEHSVAYLGNLTGRRPTWFACPFGGSGAADADIATMQAAMRDCGIVASVSTVKRHVMNVDNVLALPRFDTIDLPPRTPG